MPESIIVAIPNNQGTRGRDLGNARDTFKQYIKDEVIPFVNNNYRTSQNKTIFGHSMAGAFVLNYLATEPSLFDNYIAESPVVQIFNSELLAKFHTLFQDNKTLNKSLYFTLTDVSQEGQNATDALNKLVAILEKEAPKTLRWKYDFIENQIHMTTPYLTMYKGFTEVYYDYQSPIYTSYDDYISHGGMQQLEAYYANRAAKYQSENVITENTIRRLTNVLLADNQESLAIELLQQNTVTHSESRRAYNSLARAYGTISKPEDAKKALEWIDSASNHQWWGAKNFENLAIKANLLNKMNRTDESLAMWKEAIDLPTTQARPVFFAGLGLLEQGQNEMAHTLFLLNAKKFPKDIFVINEGLAKGYTAIGNKKKAIKHWEIALKNMPPENEPWLPQYQAELKALKGA